MQLVATQNLLRFSAAEDASEGSDRHGPKITINYAHQAVWQQVNLNTKVIRHQP